MPLILMIFVIIAPFAQLLADDGLRRDTHGAASADTVPAVFYLHSKQSVRSIDTLVARLSADSAFAAFAKPAEMERSGADHGDLDISGYKSFGVSVGELGEVNLEQGLEMSIEGKIRPGTVLKAQLSDQGASLDGSTREISEFDMIFINLTNKNFNVTAGDMFANWHDGGILSGQKKIVGIAGKAMRSSASKNWSVDAFGSFSGGNHTVQNIRGREGVQGPYYLTGKGEAEIITPVGGTVKVRINGDELEEGIDKGFVVDYDIGAVTFNPKFLISQDDFIRIEYEYKSFDYRRTFAGGGSSYYTKDSTFFMRGILWSESDNRNHPIETQLGDREKELLTNSGNNPSIAVSTARPVHPQDVAQMNVYHPLYKKIFNASAQDTILVYTPYDPQRPHDTKNFYTAIFTHAQIGSIGADYAVDSAAVRGQFVYKYVGAGKGGYTALAPIAAPTRETAGELEVRMNLPRVKASLNIAGKESDRNLFSDIDGSDLSSAILFKLSAGEKRIDKKSVWANADYRYRSQKFTNEIFSTDERKDKWGASDIVDETNGRQFQSWESTIGATLIKGASFSAGAGQSFVDSLAETEKIAADALVRFAKEKYGLDFGAAVFKHHLSEMDISHRRYGKFIAQPVKSWKGFFDYRDEWRVDTAGQGRGHLSGAVEAAYLPANLREHFNFTQYRRGDSFPGSIDTGYALTWNQSVEFSPFKIWSLTGDSRWRYMKIHGQANTSTSLISILSEIEQASNGFSSRQDYRINQELASRFEQKMYYIGKGLGTHAYDSTAGEFRPSVSGDHIIQDVEIYDNTSTVSVRKTTLSGDWYFRPAKKIGGILNDLTWNGIWSLEEHIDSRNDNFFSHIPGILSLFQNVDNDTRDPESLSLYPNYSDLSYRQDIIHHIQGSLWKSRVMLISGFRIIRGYEEPAFETSLLIERKKKQLTLSAEPGYLSVTRKNLAGDHGVRQTPLNISDINARFIQSLKYNTRSGTFEFYVRERIGIINDNSPNRRVPIPADSCIYFHIKPGVAHKPKSGGVAELAYIFSYMPWNGELDYRVAGGTPRGLSHTVSFVGDINAGKHFTMSGLYKSELTRRLGENVYAPITHVFSLQVKASL